MKDKATLLVERIQRINGYKPSGKNEEEAETDDINKSSYQDDNVDNEEDDTEMPSDDTDESPDEQNQMEQIELKMMDSLTDIGLMSCEAEMEDNSLMVDMTFEDGTELTVQMFVEDGTPKAVILDGSDEPVEQIDLPSEFSDEDGNLVVNVDSIPVDAIRQSISNIVKIEKEGEVTQESFRWKNGIVESITKKSKFEKKVAMRYKKESMKKKSKGKRK